jgi:hypothetical protein
VPLHLKGVPSGSQLRFAKLMVVYAPLAEVRLLIDPEKTVVNFKGSFSANEKLFAARSALAPSGENTNGFPQKKIPDESDSMVTSNPTTLLSWTSNLTGLPMLDLPTQSPSKGIGSGAAVTDNWYALLLRVRAWMA